MGREKQCHKHHPDYQNISLEIPVVGSAFAHIILTDKETFNVQVNNVMLTYDWPK